MLKWILWTKSCSPTIVITANNEVQTHEEAIVYVKELGIFLTLKVLENTPAVFVAWKALRWKRIFLWMDQRSKTNISFKNGIRIQCNTENFVPIVVPGLSTSSSSSSHHSTSKTPSRQERHLFYIFFKLVFFTNDSNIKVTVRLEKERIEMKMILLPCLCQVSMLMIERWNPLFSSDSGMRSQANQNPKTNKEETTIERWNPLFADSVSSAVEFWNPGLAARIQRKYCGWKSSWTQRLTRQFFSWSIFRAHIREKWGFG